MNIDQAVIRDLIAAQITVSMLKAGDISADKFHITSDDGGLEIVGNTMQFKDKNGVVRIQLVVILKTILRFVYMTKQEKAC